MEKRIQLKRAAEMLGVQARTLKGWLIEMGFAMPASPQAGRRVILVPERLVERAAERRSVKVARV